MSILFKPSGSLDVATDPCDLPQNSGSVLTGDQGAITSTALARCKNLRLDQTGVVKTRDGSTRLSTRVLDAIYKITEQSGNRYTFANTRIYRNESSLISGLTSAAWAAMLYNSWNDTNEQVFSTNGTDRKRIQGSSVYEWGIDAPTTDPATVTGSAQGALSGVYNAKYTYARKDGTTVICESNPSAADDAVTLVNGHLQVLVTQPTDTQVTHIRFYRTLADGGTYYYDSDTAISDALEDLDFAISKAWEDDGTNGLQYYDIIGTDYSYVHGWEETGAYIEGDGFMFTTAGASYNYTYSWESDYSTTTTITAWTVTGPDDYCYAGAYFDLSELTYYISGDSYQFNDSTGYTYSWEPYYSYSDDAYEDIDAMVRNVPMFGFEDEYFGYYILWIPDGSLGAELATNHDRPPLDISFLLGPNFNGTCFAIVSNLLYFSLPKQPEYWPTSYNVEIAPVQYPGQCMVFFNGIPHVLTKTEIYAVQGTGAESFFPYRMNAITGCLGPMCACSVHGQGIYHIGTDGVYLFNGSEDRKISQAAFEPIFRGEDAGGLPGMTDATKSWILSRGNRLYIGYVSTGYTYPTNVLVLDIDTARVTYYAYSMEIITVEVDKYNDRLLAGDSDGYVWHLDDKDVATDNGTAISWELQSKDFMLQTRAHFPRWCKYDVDASDADCSATGQVILEGAVHQSHTITGQRDVKKRLVTTGNGQRMALRLTGSGPVSIYAVEAE